MAAFDPATLERWRALAIVDRDGTTVGTISEFYLDRETGHPTWALVETGLFGTTQTFVPLVHATEIADGLQVPYARRHIRDSPRVDPHDELTPDEEARLFAHYGVDYEPAVEGPGPVPVDASTAEEVEAVPEEPGTTAGSDPAPGGPETTEGSASVPEEPGTIEDLETAEGPETPPEASGVGQDPETTASGRPAPMGSEAPPAPMTSEAPPTFIASEPPPTSMGSEPPPTSMGSEAPPTSMGSEAPPTSTGSEEGSGTVSGELGTAEGPGRVPSEAGTGGPDDATLIAPGEFGGPPDHPQDAPDPDLSRTAPVDPGLPGSTAASPGPVPTTVDKDSDDPEGLRSEEAPPDHDEPQWAPAPAPAPAPAGSFDEPDPADRPTRSSDRWREAKLAAERERIARTAAAQPEERSPLERARRRLERLVGVGQDHPEDDAISSADREEAERARRARLGFDEDDPRLR